MTTRRTIIFAALVPIVLMAAFLTIASFETDRTRLIAWALACSVLASGVLLGLGQLLLRRLHSLSTVARSLHATRDLSPLADGDVLDDFSRALRHLQAAVLAAQDASDRYRALAQSSLDIIYFVRASDRCLIEVNSAAERAYGYTRDELLTMTSSDLRSPAYRGEHESASIAAAHSGGSRFEFMQLRKDGTTFPVENVAQLMRIGGEDIFVNVVRDISERERTRAALAAARDQAMEASRLKSEFVATMSHEIRTPMNGIIGMCDLLLQTALTGDQREFAVTVRDSAYSLLAIINDILDFSKIEAGKLELEIIEFEPVRLIESVADLLAAQAHGKKLSLMTYVDPDIPHRLLGDPGRLRQILINLVNNAVKFTDSGSVSVLAALDHETPGEACLCIRVRDTGIGMSPQVLSKLFQAFTQADGTTTRRFGGTGLGLSISKRLVELMHGTIKAESQEGQGSTFTFTAWFQKAPERSAQLETPRLHGLRSLLVDDDAIAREILSRELSSWGIVVESFATAIDALAALRGDTQSFDLALIDLRMPTIDGFELGGKIRSDARLAGLRMIMITAFDDGHIGKAALAAGFSAFLTKPVRQSQLFDCIARVMNLSGPSQAEIGSTPPGGQPLRGGRILVVEDNVINQRVARRQLERLCSDEIVIVPDGQQAVEAVATGTFALVFMDCHMPVMDGFTATRLIRKAEALRGNHVPIVAMTANALEGDRDACLSSGMDDYVAKPIQFEELRRAVARWLPETMENEGSERTA